MGSPLRTVATMRPAPSAAIWCSRVAESWSSRWASSTPAMVSGLLRMDSRAETNRAIGSRGPVEPTHGANAPSGRLREVSVHAAQCTGAVSDAVTVRARVVLPTPAAPITTTPRQSVPVSAARIDSCSTGRSSNCQRLAIAGVYAIIQLAT
jgi:hypothetical protein